MTRLTALLAGAALIGLPTMATAVEITNNQGQACFTGMVDCQAVASERSDIDAIDDGDVTTFFSLGAGGSINVDVTPMFFDGGIMTIEITNGNPNVNFPESARFEFSGPDGSDFVELSNQPAFLLASSGITATRTNDGAQSIFTIDLQGQRFDMLMITDTTLDRFPGSYTVGMKRTDGFDIAELQFDTRVPAPGAIALFGLGALALGIRRRR